MDAVQLEAQYRRYITRLNDHRPEDLEDFVQDELTYNGEPMTRQDYQDLIAANIAAIPDLRFQVHLLVVGDDHVGCRLVFDCTPTSTFLGAEPTGESISFAEHVFYRFQDGRIVEVWSLLDESAVRAQLA